MALPPRVIPIRSLIQFLPIKENESATPRAPWTSILLRDECTLEKISRIFYSCSLTSEEPSNSLIKDPMDRGCRYRLIWKKFRNFVIPNCSKSENRLIFIFLRKSTTTWLFVVRNCPFSWHPTWTLSMCKKCHGFYFWFCQIYIWELNCMPLPSRLELQSWFHVCWKIAMHLVSEINDKFVQRCWFRRIFICSWISNNIFIDIHRICNYQKPRQWMVAYGGACACKIYSKVLKRIAFSTQLRDNACVDQGFN